MECEDANDFIEIDDSDDDDVHCDTPPAIVSTDSCPIGQNVKIGLLEQTAANHHGLNCTRNGKQAAHVSGNAAESSVESQSNDESVAVIESCDATPDVQATADENESHAEMNGSEESLENRANNQHADDIDIGSETEFK